MMKDYWSLAESRNRDAIVSLYVIHFLGSTKYYRTRSPYLRFNESQITPSHFSQVNPQYRHRSNAQMLIQEQG
jgi:hypothetical protein